MQGRGHVLPVYASIGLNNYKSEWRVSALVAAASGRSLCLPRFIDGKTLTDVEPWEVQVRTVYDLDVLSHFIALEPDANTDACPSHDPHRCTHAAHHLCGKAENSSISDVMTSAGRLQKALSRYASSQCVALWGCQWLPLVVPTLSFALWQHLIKPHSTRLTARETVSHLFGTEPYVAIHWRFEEHRCLEQQLPIGLCTRTMRHGTRALPLDDLVAIVTRAMRRLGMRHLFLATDGRERGGGALVDEFRRRTSARQLDDYLDTTQDAQTCAFLAARGAGEHRV